MTTYYLRDRTTLEYRRQPWAQEARQFPTRHEAERYRTDAEEIVAVSSRPLVPLHRVTELA